MPLSEPVRHQLAGVPALDQETTPPSLTAGSLPETGDLSYSDFAFDRSNDVIDRGGNAAVYRATVGPDDEHVALKHPFPNKTVDRDTVRRITDEVTAWARLDDHPYIATVLDWETDPDPVPWIAVEYLDGGHVTRLSDSITVEQRLWTAYAMADAVAYASGQQGVTHHDLKPANILLQQMPGDTWAVPKIIDWELSRELIQHDGSINQSTPKYAAPEQNPCIMPGVEVGVHTDVYQLGVVCYEVLTDTYPSHLGGSVSPPSDIDPDLPAVIDEILLRALSHEREQRYEQPIQFRDALADVLKRLFTSNQIKTSRSSGREAKLNTMEVDDGWETGSNDWDDVDPDPDVEDAIIIDSGETERDEVQWPEESDADSESADVAAQSDAAEPNDGAPEDAETIDAGKPGINPVEDAGGGPRAGTGGRQTAPPNRVEFYCPNCDHAWTAGASSIRAGDICPECKRGYLAERKQ
jgi:serine/threonine protein kinase